MPHTHRPDRPLSIGELARASGLSASALRFYDREGVLVPDDVDPQTGYRRYAVGQVRAARLLASLRRVGMPLAEVALVLDEDARGASGVAADVVAAHEQRLVDGLADARAEIRRTLALLAAEADGHDARCCFSVRAGDLLEALASVRFAVAPGTPVSGAPDGPDLQVLTGILLEANGSDLRCVATDRYRMALAGVPVSHPVVGPAVPVAAVVPAAWADRIAQECAAVAGETEVAVELGEGQVGVRVAGELLATPVVPGTFPDYRPVVEPAPRAGAAAAGDLLSRLPVEAGSVGPVVRDGTVSLAPSDAVASAADVFVDPEFLREALAVAGSHARLELDGYRRPLAIRGDGAGFSVLMPVAPDGLSS